MCLLKFVLLCCWTYKITKVLNSKFLQVLLKSLSSTSLDLLWTTSVQLSLWLALFSIYFSKAKTAVELSSWTQDAIIRYFRLSGWRSSDYSLLKVSRLDDRSHWTGWEPVKIVSTAIAESRIPRKCVSPVSWAVGGDRVTATALARKCCKPTGLES